MVRASVRVALLKKAMLYDGMMANPRNNAKSPEGIPRTTRLYTVANREGKWPILCKVDYEYTYTRM